MTQGIYVKGRRPKSKKEIRELVLTDPTRVVVEATSIFGNDYEGPVTEIPEGKTITFVGPDPYRDRRFYGNITRKGEKVTVR